MGKKQEKAEKERIKRLEAFDNYYSAIYKDRYIKLKEALLKDNEAVSFSQNLISEYFLDRASILVAQLLPLKEGDNVLDMCAAPGGKTLVMLSKMNGNILIQYGHNDKICMFSKNSPILSSCHLMILQICFKLNHWLGAVLRLINSCKCVLSY